jgi:hypothetical protein
LEPSVASLQKENEQLRGQIGDLQAQLATPSTGPTSSGDQPAQVPLPGGLTERRSTKKTGPITLRAGYKIDLDNNTSPNWDPNSTSFTSMLELDWESGGLGIHYDYAIEANFRDTQTCAEETAYHNDALGLGDIHKGETLCIRTDQKRYASLRIVSVSPQALTFETTVWDPPYQ